MQKHLAATRWYRWCSPPRIGVEVSLTGPVIGASALGCGIDSTDPFGVIRNRSATGPRRKGGTPSWTYG